jgi:hypothetical protein
MACKIVNLIACIVYIIALFLILFSFEPKKMGGIYHMSSKNQGEAPRRRLPHDSMPGYMPNYFPASNEYPGEILVHPFYISWTKDYNSPTPDGDDAPTDEKCLARFGPTVSGGYSSANATKDGLLRDNSVLPCIVSILSASARSKYAQRRYANYVFGAAYDTADMAIEGYGPRTFFKTDYNLNTGGNQNGQLVPNIWATQDAVFFLCQISGFFLAFGIVFHILAFLMGGFMWNYSECCCDFGICAFVFNAVVWSGLSLGSYIISLGAFAAIFFAGRKNDAPELVVKWSVGGAFLVSGIVLSAIAISLASYQWAHDRKTKEDEELDQAVDNAVRRASKQGKLQLR